MVKVKIEPYVVFRTEVLHYEVNLPFLFSPLVCDAQCCEVKIHFAIYNFWGTTTIANEKQQKFECVIFSPVGFFRNVAVFWWARFGLNRRRLHMGVKKL